MANLCESANRLVTVVLKKKIIRYSIRLYSPFDTIFAICDRPKRDGESSSFGNNLTRAELVLSRGCPALAGVAARQNVKPHPLMQRTAAAPSMPLLTIGVPAMCVETGGMLKEVPSDDADALRMDQTNPVRP
jgi:hypothetical protein